MNCNKVSHLISAYMDGELLGYEHRHIFHHLQRCASCQEEYESLLQMKRLLSAMRVQEPGKSLAAEILQRVGSQNTPTQQVGLNSWKHAAKGYGNRAMSYTSVVGVGVGLMAASLLLVSRIQGTVNNDVAAYGALKFNRANIANDQPPPPVGELTNGLTHDALPQPVVWEPRYPDNLPGSAFESRHEHKVRNGSTQALFIR